MFNGIMPNDPKPHVVAVLCVDSVVAPDAAIPCETFSRTRTRDGAPAYEVKACSEGRMAKSACFNIVPPYGLSALSRADTIIIPGLEDLDTAVSSRVLRALQRAHKRGARIASICTGAFVLGESGLLNGLDATTHWAYAGAFAQCYPAVRVNPDVLYTDNGQILTSAGAMAGLDLCLHMIRRDFGAEVAANVARLSVAPLERAGGQRQFIKHELPEKTNGPLSPLLDWIESRLSEDLTIARLASETATSPRTLHRRFVEQVSMPPMRWIALRRVNFAKRLLETGSLSIEQIAVETGLGSATNFREHFQRLVGKSPTAYRGTFVGVGEG